jgi:hypothetical protein
MGLNEIYVEVSPVVGCIPVFLVLDAQYPKEIPGGVNGVDITRSTKLPITFLDGARHILIDIFILDIINHPIDSAEELILRTTSKERSIYCTKVEHQRNKKNKMYIEDHTFQIPSPPIDVKKFNPLTLTSPHTSYTRQNSSSSIASSLSSASGSGFRSYSPPPSAGSSYFSSPIDNNDDEDVRVSNKIDLHARALLLLSLLYSGTFSTDAPTPVVVKNLIHPSCIFEVEHLDATTSTINSRDAYLKGWSEKLNALEGQVSSRVRECCVDEGQRKVWVVNELVVGKVRKESVDMLSFDERGRMVRWEGWLRRTKTRRGRGHEE